MCRNSDFLNAKYMQVYCEATVCVTVLYRFFKKKKNIFTSTPLLDFGLTIDTCSVVAIFDKFVGMHHLFARIRTS
jgi:hypothetical protein